MEEKLQSCCRSSTLFYRAGFVRERPDAPIPDLRRNSVESNNSRTYSDTSMGPPNGELMLILMLITNLVNFILQTKLRLALNELRINCSCIQNQSGTLFGNNTTQHNAQIFSVCLDWDLLMNLLWHKQQLSGGSELML